MAFTWRTDAELKQLPVNGSNTGKKRRAEANRNKLQGQIVTNLLGTGTTGSKSLDIEYHRITV